jgi:hypothetical protein
MRAATIATATIAAMLLSGATPARASSRYYRGFIQRNATYVAPHFHTEPDHGRLINWSSCCIVSPSRGEKSTPKPPNQNPETAPR